MVPTSKPSVAHRPLAQAVWQLEEEHDNFKRLLTLFERELAVFLDGEKPDYALMRDVMHYMIQYPDRVHHPREDLMLERLVRRTDAAQPMVAALMREHEQLTARAAELLAALEEILGDAFVARGSFEAMASEYVARLREHMHKEEETLFPMFLEYLTSSDRAALEGAFAGQDDPLFGADVAPGYRAIFQRLSGGSPS